MRGKVMAFARIFCIHSTDLLQVLLNDLNLTLAIDSWRTQHIASRAVNSLRHLGVFDRSKPGIAQQVSLVGFPA